MTQEQMLFVKQGVEVVGPIAFAKLRAAALTERLHETDLEGTGQSGPWSPAVSVSGLRFGRQFIAEEPKLKPEETGEYPGFERAKYACYLVLLFMMFPIVMVVLGALLASTGLFTAAPSLVYGLYGLAIIGLAALVALCGIRRCDNLGVSRWWVLAQIIPGASLIPAYMFLGFPPGWAKHRRTDAGTMVVGAFLAMVTLLTIAQLLVS